MGTREAVTAGLEGLRASLDGRVVLPGDEGWDAARQAWNLAVDQRPTAVALPESAEDVIAVVRVAREHGLRVAAQATGHNAAPLGPLADTVLLKTAHMTGAQIDAEARRARVLPGTLWGQVAEPAAEHGLAALTGSSPDVGVMGYSLGGGIGWLARRHGLACNSVLAAEMVTADGRLVRADGESDPDLFWALRGGGGSFGVVTALEFALYPVREIYAGDLFWPLERATEVLHCWREWVPTVPAEVTSVGRLLSVPPLPEIPEMLRGRSFVLVEAAYLGTESDGAELLAPLRALEPEIDTFAMIPPPALAGLHMDPPEPVPAAGDGMLLSEAPAEAIDAMIAAAGPDSGSPLLSVELRHLGGALVKAAPEHGALASLDAAFAAYSVGMAMDADMAAAVKAHLAVVRNALTPWDAGRGYMNFTERPTEARSLFPAETYRRLEEVKATYDPGGLFQANFPIAPAR